MLFISKKETLIWSSLSITDSTIPGHYRLLSREQRYAAPREHTVVHLALVKSHTLCADVGISFMAWQAQIH
jgi:hypothetical protein